MDDLCEACGRGREINGVQHSMLLSATRGIYSAPEDVRRYHLACLPPDVEAEHRARHGEQIDAAKAAMSELVTVTRGI